MVHRDQVQLLKMDVRSRNSLTVALVSLTMSGGHERQGGRGTARVQERKENQLSNWQHRDNGGTVNWV